jgi:CRISPR type I-E-associated protein CasB/Cse2
VTPTEQYIEVLSRLQPGDLGLLRNHAGQGLDESVDAFDLFTGLWWPLRQRDQRAPRREVAWLIAKLYAFRPAPQSPCDTLASQLRKCQPPAAPNRFIKQFDAMLALPVAQIEPALQWALDQIASRQLPLDWVRLTDDLSFWNDTTRLKWAEEYLNI